MRTTKITAIFREEVNMLIQQRKTFIRFLLCLLFVLIACSTSHGQNKFIFHYPLDKGDYWEYEQIPPLYRIYRKVIGDTLMPNGKVYKILQEANEISSVYPPKFWKCKFQRINKDCTEVYQFVHIDSIPPEEKIYNLHVVVGDTWKFPKNSIIAELSVDLDSALLKIGNIQKQNVLGRELNVMDIDPSPGGIVAPYISIADSIGVINQGAEMLDYNLKGAIINGVKYGIITSEVKDKTSNLPNNIQLHINPNPFNSETEISYTLPKTQYIEISIYDILGRKKVTLVQEKMDKGSQMIFWSGVDQKGQILPSGIYLCVILGEYFWDTEKMCILR